MAITKIIPASSIITNAVGLHAFEADTAGADTLIVDPGAYLIARGVLAIPAQLKSFGQHIG